MADPVSTIRYAGPIATRFDTRAFSTSSGLLSGHPEMGPITHSMTEQLIEAKVDPAVVLPRRRFLVFTGTDG
jgi:hypothetical protein